MVAEGLLPVLPLLFQTTGIESNVTNIAREQKFGRHGEQHDLNTPEKEKSMRFKSRS